MYANTVLLIQDFKWNIIQFILIQGVSECQILTGREEELGMEECN